MNAGIKLIFLIILPMISMQLLSNEVQIETAEEATAGIDWQFEFKNKYNPVTVTLYYDDTGETIFSNKKLDYMDMIRAATDPMRNLKLVLDGVGNQVYIIRPAGKTVFLKLVGGTVEPQEGPLKGFLGVTTSGLSNKDNITEADIEHLKNLSMNRAQNIPQAPSATFFSGSQPFKIETTRQATMSAPWNFEIMNDTGHTILVVLSSKSKKLINTTLEADQVARAVIDTKQILSLAVTMKITTAVIKDIAKPELVTKKLTPNGKTVFLEATAAMNTNFVLRPDVVPQESSGRGDNKTNSGLSLSNNIEASEVAQVF